MKKKLPPEKNRQSAGTLSTSDGLFLSNAGLLACLMGIIRNSAIERRAGLTLLYNRIGKKGLGHY
jgi:hypothetical protein